MYVVPVAANAFHIDRVPIADALRCLQNNSNYLFIQQRFPVLDRKYHVVVDLPGAVISFSNLFTSHEGSVQDVPVASHGELQVKSDDALAYPPYLSQILRCMFWQLGILKHLQTMSRHALPFWQKECLTRQSSQGFSLNSMHGLKQ